METAVIVADVHGDRRRPRSGEVTHSVMVRVKDARKHCEQARARVVRILMEPTDFEYGERQYTAEDLAGHRWTFSETRHDVGCGDGRNAIELARRFGLRLHGIDPVPRNIELASSRAAAEGLSNAVQFHLGTAEALPISDEMAHLVWCKEVLTLTSVDLAFSEFRRVLRPGGVGFVYQVLTATRKRSSSVKGSGLRASPQCAPHRC